MEGEHIPNDRKSRSVLSHQAGKTSKRLLSASEYPSTRFCLLVERFIDEIMASQRAAPEARKSHTQVETVSSSIKEVVVWPTESWDLQVILVLIHFEGPLAALRGASGLILIVGVLATLVATLGREVARPENMQKA
jgi:hypothetical protein